MRLPSILFTILNLIIFLNINCLLSVDIGVIRKLNEQSGNIIYSTQPVYYYEKIPPQHGFATEVGSFGAFYDGVEDAFVDNIKNISRSLLYPAESVFRILNFCKKIVCGFFDFLLNPQTDDVYIAIIQEKVERFSLFFNNMSLGEKLKWGGYITTDFIIGYFTPFGLGWKLIFFTKSFIKSYKYFNFIDKLNKIPKFNQHIVKIVNSSNSGSLLSIKYSFEYMDQFRQYLNDFIKREG